jgi:hypothetical protein
VKEGQGRGAATDKKEEKEEKDERKKGRSETRR